jgi:hypothetical protein
LDWSLSAETSVTADKLSHFVDLKDYKQSPETIRITNVSFSGGRDQYLNRMLPFWKRFSSALGGDEQLLVRLELTPEVSLGALNSGVPNAEHLFGLLNERVPQSIHARADEHMVALVKFAPESDQLREMVMDTIRRRSSGNDGRGLRTNRDGRSWWRPECSQSCSHGIPRCCAK